MKNSINNLNNLLSTREKLTELQLLNTKGGGGEDIRRDGLRIILGKI